MKLLEQYLSEQQDLIDRYRSLLVDSKSEKDSSPDDEENKILSTTQDDVEKVYVSDSKIRFEERQCTSTFYCQPADRFIKDLRHLHPIATDNLEMHLSDAVNKTKGELIDTKLVSPVEIFTVFQWRGNNRVKFKVGISSGNKDKSNPKNDTITIHFRIRTTDA